MTRIDKLTHALAIRQAHHHWTHRANYTREDRVNAVVELAEHKAFSNRQIARFTGMKSNDVAEYTGKTDRTGGKLPGEALKPILDVAAMVARGEWDAPLVRAAVAAGASTWQVAKFTGLSQSAVMRAIRAGAK